MKEKTLTTKLLSDLALQGLIDKKGIDIIRMDLTDLEAAISDYFIICTGTSDRHVATLAESVMDTLAEVGEKPVSKEGLDRADWVVLDYITYVIHIFQKDKRTFYRLEDLWGDAQREFIDESMVLDGVGAIKKQLQQ